MVKSLFDTYDYSFLFFFFYLKPGFITIGWHPFFLNYIHIIFLKEFTLLCILFTIPLIYLNYFLLNLSLCVTLILLNLIPSFLFKTFSIAAISFTIKFIMLISLFIFARGGVPRYRYDFLTKVG